MIASRDPGSPVEIYADAARKVVWIHFRHRVEAPHLAAASTRFRDAVGALGRGFVLVTDISGLDEMDLNCVPHLTRNMDLCLAAGVDSVIRVIPDPRKDIGFHLLSMTHYRGRVPILTYATLSEAEAALEQRSATIPRPNV